jgi:hypothetical protein
MWFHQINTSKNILSACFSQRYRFVYMKIYTISLTRQVSPHALQLLYVMYNSLVNIYLKREFNEVRHMRAPTIAITQEMPNAIYILLQYTNGIYQLTELSTRFSKYQKSSRLKRYLTPTVVGIIGAGNEPDMVGHELKE